MVSCYVGLAGATRLPPDRGGEDIPRLRRYREQRSAQLPLKRTDAGMDAGQIVGLLNCLQVGPGKKAEKGWGAQGLAITPLRHRRNPVISSFQ